MKKVLKIGITGLFLIIFIAEGLACDFTDSDGEPNAYIDVSNFTPTCGDLITVQMTVCNDKFEALELVYVGDLTFGGDSTATKIAWPDEVVTIESKDSYVFEWTVEVSGAGILTIDGECNAGDLPIDVGETSLVIASGGDESDDGDETDNEQNITKKI